MIDLGGRWAAAPADDDLRRRYVRDDFDASAWESIDVPGHWQRHAAFAEQTDPVLQRRQFDSLEPVPGTRRWLTFDGVFYQSDVWLDGSYVGDTEGYFAPHSFEVTELLAARSEHLLAVEVTCPTPSDQRRKRTLTGAFQDGRLDPAANPGGIWAPVHVVTTGPVRILHHRVICRDATAQLATVALRVVLHSLDERDVAIHTRIAGVDHVLAQRLSAGENRFEWAVQVRNPELWWPHSMGDQPLAEVELDVRCAGVTSDRRRQRIGFRRIRMDDWILRVNDERMFVKGTSQGPTSIWLAEATRADHERDLRLAIDAHLDLVRVRSHIGRAELYDVADELGVLLWQDLPLHGGYDRSVKPSATRQASDAVDLLAHHPSVALWCGHDEPVEWDRGSIARQLLPSANRSWLDRSIATVLRSTDGSRPVIAHSGVLPTLPRLEGTDTHLSLGWERGDERQLAPLLARMPRLARFVSDLGADSLPLSLLDRLNSGAGDSTDRPWPDLDWEDLHDRLGLRRELFERFTPVEQFDTVESWALATQQRQADIIRFGIEDLRRLKYRPTGGYCHAGFADSIASVSSSVLDVDRQPKLGYRALAEASRPVIAVADRLPSHVHPDEEIVVDLHICSDLRTRLAGARLEARWRWVDGDERRVFVGDIDPDSVAFVGQARIITPNESTPLTLDLRLTIEDPAGASEIIDRRDETYVIAGAHHH